MLPVTTVLKIHYRQASYQACLRWMEDTAAIASSFSGFISKDIYTSVEAKNILLNIFTFASLEELEAWESSEKRKVQTQKGEHVFEEVAEKRQLSGLEFLFQLKGAKKSAPPRWKMVLVTTFIIFTLLNTIVPYIQKGFTFLELPGLLKSLLGIFIVVCLMTYLLLPFLTKRFYGWLSKP